MVFQHVCKLIITFSKKDKANQKINNHLNHLYKAYSLKYPNKIVKGKVWNLIWGKINKILEDQII